MKFSFVILTWNRYKFLEKCIAALLSSISGKYLYEVIIMDNGSTDCTPEILEQYKKNENVRIITRNKNYGLKAYKRLFFHARGEYVVIVDDDVLEFPESVDTLFLDYMENFKNYGFIALNVIQNEFTDGAKPSIDMYTEETKGDMVIEAGPTGGWCACFRKRDYNKILFRFLFTKVNMKVGEDGLLSALFWKHLRLKHGLIKNAYCFHACGPYYAKEYGHLDREIEKYKISGLDEHVERYKKFE
ncbi:glycosyltransferase family 2 protein [Pedobacter suwonensis]|uniref:glycosyltransferase family 2 protein n=1 Tax=Pedobacter suwonensis TaxID=332999 RepID=UPI003689C6F9